MERIYIITGADGHLGGALVRKLQNKDCLVRGLIFSDESEKTAASSMLSSATSKPASELLVKGPRTHKQPAEPVGNIRYYKGDVRKTDTLMPLFEGIDPRETIVIHTAGIVDISTGASRLMKDVNVGGTRNMIGLCKGYGVKRLVYVSSVHAIPEGDPMRVITEVDHFSADMVVGGYAKTKAEATQAVLDSI
ncbi:MAG: NAD-dependent epimerase/dehydratase family protein, partial [Clostridia bacterium]|nr:NAD-dependent epimerase/dehydratase family protein [Clostridia bacterium]